MVHGEECSYLQHIKFHDMVFEYMLQHIDACSLFQKSDTMMLQGIRTRNLKHLTFQSRNAGAFTLCISHSKTSGSQIKYVKTVKVPDELPLSPIMVKNT